MSCKICGKKFIRGTDSLSPSYDFCSKCARIHFTYESVEISKEEQIQEYCGLIEVCENQNKKCKETIDKNENLIEHFNKQIKELSLAK